MSNALHRKAHPSARIKTLPEDLQERIYEVCQAGTYKDAIRWLADEMKITISDSALSDWFGWRTRKLAIEQAESEATEIRDLLASPGLQLSPAQLAGIGNAIFINRATKVGDAKTFREVAGVVQRSQELEANQAAHADKMTIARRKLELQAAEHERKLKELEMKVARFEKEKKAAEDVMQNASKKGGMSPETRKALRQALGMADDDEPTP
jgi:hypothetical protein